MATEKKLVVKKVQLGVPIRRVSGVSTNLDGLSDVTITSVQNGHIIVYNTYTGKWENASLDSGEGLNLSWDSSANSWSLSAEFATATNPGIASFSSSDFTVGDSGDVTVKFNAIPESLVPATDSAYDLGSVTKKWKDLYLSGNTIYIGGQNLSYDSAAGQLEFNGNAVLTTGTDGDSAIRALFSDDGKIISYNASTGVIGADSAVVRNIFSADGKILGYNALTGAFSVDSSDIRNIFSASGSLSYDSATGAFSYTDSDRTAAQIKGLFSASGSLSYNSTTGQFSYSDSDRTASVIKGMFSATGGGLTYDSSTGQFTDSDRSAAEIKGLISADGKILGYNSSTGVISADSSDIRNIFSASGSLSYDSATGQFSYTDSDRSAASIKGLFSAAGSLSYNSSTGEFSYTDSDRSAAQIKGLLTADGKILGYNSTTGAFSVDSSDIRNIFSASGDTQILSYDSASGQFSTSLVDSDIAKTNTNEVFHLGLTIPDTKLLNFNDSTDTAVASLSHSNDVLSLDHNGRIRIQSGEQVRIFAYDSVRIRATNIGATINGRITADSAFFDGIQLSDSIGHPAYSEGLVWYDNIHKTLNFYGDDSNVIHEIGIEEHQRVYNNTGADIAAGKPLYFSGNYNPGGAVEPVPTVGLADATDVNAYNAQGLSAALIKNGTYGYMIRSGLVEGFDTSGLTAGQNVFVGLGPGLLQNASPTYPNYPMCIGWVVKSDASNGAISINQQNHSVRSFRVQTDAHIGNNLRIDGNLTVVGTQTITSTENINIGGAIQYLNAGNTIGEAGTTFVGTGLDDAFFAGHYSGDSSSKSFFVKIDATGTPDTFEWGYDSTVGTQATGIAITGAAQMLDSAYNISIDFGATTGHTVGDKWTGTATAVNADTGIFSNRNAGSNYTHVGMYFDVSTNKWTFLNAYDSEPGVVINPANGTYGALKAATYEGDLTGDVTGTVSDVSNHYTTIKNLFSAGGDLTYDSAAGQFSYTDSDRSRAQILGLFSASGGGLSYNNSTGAFTDSDRSRAQILGLFSASGGGLSYNNSTGAFTDSDRSAAQIKQLITANKGIDYNSTTGELNIDSANVRGMFSGAGNISYNSSTGEFSYTDSDRSRAQILGLFSASGGGLSYNSSTGAFTDSDRSATQIKGLFSVSGEGLTYDSASGAFALDDSDRTRSQILGLFSASGGGLSYNNTTGAFTDSDRSAAQIKGMFSSGGDITYDSSSGQISFTQRTAIQLMEQLLTVDSDNSGLNADTLDGQEGTYYRINVYNAAGTLLN